MFLVRFFALDLFNNRKYPFLLAIIQPSYFFEVFLFRLWGGRGLKQTLQGRAFLLFAAKASVGH